MAKATYWQRGETLDYTNGSGSKIDANTIVVLKSGATGRIGVIGTTATIRAGAYGKAIRAIRQDAAIMGKPAAFM